MADISPFKKIKWHLILAFKFLFLSHNVSVHFKVKVSIYVMIMNQKKIATEIKDKAKEWAKGDKLWFIDAEEEPKPANEVGWCVGNCICGSSCSDLYWSKVNLEESKWKISFRNEFVAFQ